ncbi:MAG: LptF/LptG family permease [Cyclobacteriaceae bacterium]
MKILDKYIIKKVLYTFFFVVLIIVAIVTVIDLAEKMDKFARNNLDAQSILGYYRDFLPWIIGLVSPIMVFIAVVFVTSQMAARTEIIAILSGGVSFRRLLIPYFLASLVIAVFNFVLNGWVIPQSNRSRLAFEMQYFNKTYYFDQRNVHMQIEPNVYFYLQNYNINTNTGYQFTLERFEDNRLVDKLTADNITWDTTKNKWTMRFWKRKAVDSIFNVGLKKKIEPDRLGEQLDTTLAVTPADFENADRKYDGMTINELTEHINKLKFRGAAGVEAYEVERHIRFSSPFTIFVLVFMGVIVSSRKSRGGTGFQIALGFLLSFIFILFFMMSRTFAEAGSLSPLIAAWLPNITFALISLGMYKYVPR